MAEVWRLSGAGREASLAGCSKVASGTEEASSAGDFAVQGPFWSFSVTNLGSSFRDSKSESLSELEQVMRY